MPIEVAIWEVSKETINKIDYTSIESETKLEKILTKDLSIISDDLLLIGNQIRTAHGKIIDMLAVNSEGKISIIELKKNKTPREVVAQSLDYASWVQNLSFKDIIEIFKENNEDKSFETSFFEMYEINPPEELNKEHDIIIVSSELDPETERIINYLSDNYGVPINAVFFKYFKQDGKEFLTRSWLIDPNEVTEKVSNSKMLNKKESWNGRDFVGNVDVIDNNSTWDDCQRYGFISAGGGKWYSNSLKPLFPGARIFAMIPSKGYIGVGIVKERAVPIKEFFIEQDGKKVSFMDVPVKTDLIKKDVDDLEKCEYMVKVDWVKTVPENKAFWEKGMRANQNSAFKLKSEFTLEKLVKFFGLDE